ncbi:hypothetical protein IGI04_011478, partial [Brassica rapa subsp. trilocularis]
MAFNRLLNSIDHDFIFNAHYPSARRCIFTYKKRRSLCELGVLAEATILDWFHKGTNSKSMQTFVKSPEPFVNWLEEADEEES